MAKRILSVGFDTPDEDLEFVSHNSSASLLDGDIVIFNPDLYQYSSYEWFSGHRLLGESDSAALKANAVHWRNEILTLVRAGKTVLVMMTESPLTYFYTGERQYSGTGRSRQTTNIVNPFEPYSCIPFNVGSVIRRFGDRIKPAGELGPLATYWTLFGRYTNYQVYAEGSSARPFLVTAAGDKLVATIVRLKDAAGALVLLPPPDFEAAIRERVVQVKSKAKAKSSARKTGKQGPHQSYELKASKSVSLEFVQAIVELDRALRSDAERTPPPPWAEHPTYKIQEELSLELELKDIATKIQCLEQERSTLLEKLAGVGGLRDLLFEKGRLLELIILAAMRSLGFSAERFQSGQSEFDVVLIAPEGQRLIGEAEGKDDKPIGVEKLDQLERNIREDFAQRENGIYAGGILFGNAFRLTDPARRGDFFSEKCKSAAERSGIGLVCTPDLFRVAQYLQDHQDPEFAKRCREALISTKGKVVEFPSVPTSNQ